MHEEIVGGGGGSSLSCRTEPCTSLSVLVERVRARRVHVLVVDPDTPGIPREGTAVLGWFGNVLKLLGSTPTLVWGRPRWLHSHRVLALGRIGVREVVIRGEEDRPALLAPLLEKLVTSRRFEGLLRALPTQVPGEIVSYLGALTILPDEWTPPTPSLIGKALGCDRATVFRKFRASGLRPPGEMIGWIRVYVVTCLVEEGMPVERAAMAVGFGSVGNFWSMAERRLRDGRSGVVRAVARGSGAILERLAESLGVGVA